MHLAFATYCRVRVRSHSHKCGIWDRNCVTSTRYRAPKFNWSANWDAATSVRCSTASGATISTSPWKRCAKAPCLRRRFCKRQPLWRSSDTIAWWHCTRYARRWVHPYILVYLLQQSVDWHFTVWFAGGAYLHCARVHVERQFTGLFTRRWRPLFTLWRSYLHSHAGGFRHGISRIKTTDTSWSGRTQCADRRE